MVAIHKFRGMLGVIIIVLALLACSKESGFKSPEEAFEHTNIQAVRVIHKVDVKDGAILFYEGKNKDVGVGFARYESGKWQWVTGHGMVSASSEPVTQSWSNLDKMNEPGEGYHLFWGSLNQDHISRVHLKYSQGLEHWGLNEDAEIMETGLGYRIWYIIEDQYYGTIPGRELTGYTAAGEIVYKND